MCASYIASSDDALLGGRAQESARAPAGRSNTDIRPNTSSCKSSAGVLGRQPELGREPRRHREDLKAAVPCRRGAQLALGHRVQHLLRGRALRAEVHQTGQQHAGVQEHAHGHLLRSSSMSAATSTAGRLSAPAVGRATSRFPTLTSRGPSATRSSLTPVSSSEISITVPGIEPGPLPDGRWDYQSTCLVDGCSHAIRLPSRGGRATFLWTAVLIENTALSPGA